MSNATDNKTTMDIGEMHARQGLTVVTPILTIVLGVVLLILTLKKEGTQYRQMKWMVTNIAAIIILKGITYPVTNNGFIEIALQGNLCNFVSFLYGFCHLHGQIAAFIFLLNGYIIIVVPKKCPEGLPYKVIIGTVIVSLIIDMIVACVVAVVVQSSRSCDPPFLGHAVYGLLPPILNMLIAALAVLYFFFNGKKFRSEECRMVRVQHFLYVFGIGCFCASFVFVSQLVAFDLAVHGAKWKVFLTEILYVLYYIIAPILIIISLFLAPKPAYVSDNSQELK